MIQCRVSYNYGTNSWGTYEKSVMSFSPNYITTHNGSGTGSFGKETAPSYLVDVEASTYGLAILNARKLLGERVFPYRSNADRIINVDQPEQTLWWVHPIDPHVIEHNPEVRPCWWHDNEYTYMIDVVTNDYVKALDFAVDQIKKYKTTYVRMGQGRDLIIKKEK